MQTPAGNDKTYLLAFMHEFLKNAKMYPAQFQVEIVKNEQLIFEVIIHAKNGDPEFQYLVARLERYDKEDLYHVRYRAYLEMAASNGHPYAMFHLALHHLRGTYGYQKDSHHAGMCFDRIRNCHNDTVRNKVAEFLAKNLDAKLALQNYDATKTRLVHPPRRGFFAGKMTELEYKLALSNPKLDVSDFILITSYFLKANLGIHFAENYRRALEVSYYSMEYAQCMVILNDVLQSNTSRLSDEMINLILVSLKHEREVELHCNHSRRYFETRVEQFKITDPDEEHPASLSSDAAVRAHAIETAFQDAEEYAKKACLKAVVQHDFSDKQSGIKPYDLQNQSILKSPLQGANLILLDLSLAKGIALSETLKNSLLKAAHEKGILNQCAHANLKQLMHFLLSEEVDPNIPYQGLTALQVALSNQKYSCAWMLIEHGADYSEVDKMRFLHCMEHRLAFLKATKGSCEMLSQVLNNYFVKHPECAERQDYLDLMQDVTAFAMRLKK